MGISSSALASLVIAGTAIGGSTFALVANSAQSDINSSNISQLTSDTQVSGKIPGETIAPVDQNGNVVDQNGNIVSISPINPSPTPSPTSSPTTSLTPPVNFGGNGDDDDSEYGDSEDVNDDSDGGSYNDEGDDNDSGHDSYDGDDNEDEEDD